MSKSKLFLILASALLISCNPNPNDPNNGNDTGTGGGGTGGGGLTSNPSWFLTAEQQKQDFYYETVLFSKPVNAQSTKYRIPAIIVAKNGNIIAFADNRYTHGSDIGAGSGAIDIVYRTSKDGGKTWSPEKIILPKSTSGANENNKGDPVAFLAANGDIVVLAIAGGAWFNAPKSPSILVMAKSKDNGETWSAWKKVGEESLWKAGPFAKEQPTFIRKAFTASGRGLTLEGKGSNPKGRLMAAMLAGKNKGDGTHSGAQAALCIYSDDNGETWKPGGYVDTVNASSATSGQINEPKIIAELNDGTIVMSIRNANGYSNPLAPRLYSLSKDGGMTWNSAEGTLKEASGYANMHDADVNADGVVWTRKGEKGQDKNRILHILADGSSRRVGLGLYLSEDEAKTFTIKKKLRDNSKKATYSTSDVLPDGTIITFSEDDQAKFNNTDGMDLVFRRFNLKYLTGEVYNAVGYEKWYEEYNKFINAK